MLDPFAGSGTTLVQALESGHDATGDLAAFNCLLMRVKTARYNEFVLEKELATRWAASGVRPGSGPGRGYVGQWFAPQAGPASSSRTCSSPCPNSGAARKAAPTAWPEQA